MSDITQVKALNPKKATNEALHYGELPKNGFVRARQLLPMLNISRVTLWRWVRDGLFPKPITLGERIKAFKVEDVRAFLDAQGAA